MIYVYLIHFTFVLKMLILSAIIHNILPVYRCEIYKPVKEEDSVVGNIKRCNAFGENIFLDKPDGDILT